MTEAEWWTCNNPRDLLATRGNVTQRQLILFGCACCRRSWKRLPDDCCRQAVKIAERYVDGLCGGEELRSARAAVERRYPDIHWTADYPHLFVHKAAWLAAMDAVGAWEFESLHPLGGDTFDDMLAA